MGEHDDDAAAGSEGGSEPIHIALDAFNRATAALDEHYAQKLDELRVRESERDEEHEAAIADLEEEERKLEDELQAKEDDVNDKRAALEEEIAALDGTHSFPKQKVKLDIGGKRFTTSRSTLMSASDSFLAAMLSGRYELHSDPSDGSYFIDRDGRHFHHVLNYLRGADSFECPESKAELTELRKDAVFYRLDGLVDIVDKKLAAVKLKEIGEGSGRAMALHDAARHRGFTSATEEAWAAAAVPPKRRFK